MDWPSNRTISVVITLATGLIGAAAGWWLGFPAPALTGSALLVTVLSVLGINTLVPDFVRNACFVVIGLSMGTGVTPEVYHTAREWPLSFLLLTISLVVILAVGRLALQRLWGQDPVTATLSSIPGHLSYVLGLSADGKGDLPTISVIQSFRVLSLSLLVPFAVSLMGYDTSVMAPPGDKMELLPLTVSVGLALLIGLGLVRLRLPAALLLGGMLFSTVTHLTGLVHGHVPLWAAIPAFVIMGSLIGSRFSGATWPVLRRAAGAGLAVTVIGFVVSILFALLLVQIVDLPLPQVLIAFAPGGVESMAAMAVIMNTDPAFVAAHHIWRLLVLTFLAQWMLIRAKE